MRMRTHFGARDYTLRGFYVARNSIRARMVLFFMCCGWI